MVRDTKCFSFSDKKTESQPQVSLTLEEIRAKKLANLTNKITFKKPEQKQEQTHNTIPNELNEPKENYKLVYFNKTYTQDETIINTAFGDELFALKNNFEKTLKVAPATTVKKPIKQDANAINEQTNCATNLKKCIEAHVGKNAKTCTGCNLPKCIRMNQMCDGEQVNETVDGLINQLINAPSKNVNVKTIEQEKKVECNIPTPALMCASLMEIDFDSRRHTIVCGFNKLCKRYAKCKTEFNEKLLFKEIADKGQNNECDKIMSKGFNYISVNSWCMLNNFTRCKVCKMSKEAQEHESYLM